jgi:hypothetical protein
MEATSVASRTPRSTVSVILPFGAISNRPMSGEDDRRSRTFEPILHSQSTFDVSYDGLRSQQDNHHLIRVAIA